MAKAKKEQSPEEKMEKNEKHNDGTMSGLKKTIIGTVGTLVTAGGAFLMTYLQKPKESEKAVQQPQSININIPAQQAAASGGTKTIVVKEKAPAVAAPKPKKKEGDEFKEAEPKW